MYKFSTFIFGNWGRLNSIYHSPLLCAFFLYFKECHFFAYSTYCYLLATWGKHLLGGIEYKYEMANQESTMALKYTNGIHLTRTPVYMMKSAKKSLRESRSATYWNFISLYALGQGNINGVVPQPQTDQRRTKPLLCHSGYSRLLVEDHDGYTLSYNDTTYAFILL